MIYLQPEVKSGLGEDTFWTWFNREFESSFDLPPKLCDKDVVLQYSTLGPCHSEGGIKVALCWELYPEMAEVLNSNQWNNRIAAVMACAAESHYRVVASPLMSPYYADLGDVHSLPIGVDGDLFKPLDSKRELRLKYGLEQDKTTFLWAGTTHPMKGFAKLLRNRAMYNGQWILVWKSREEAEPQSWAKNFVQVPQTQLNELFNCADFFISTSLLRPFYMVEWEAMAANLRMICDANKDFIPSTKPRKDVESRNWLRADAKTQWKKFIERISK